MRPLLPFVRSWNWISKLKVMKFQFLCDSRFRVIVEKACLHECFYACASTCITIEKQGYITGISGIKRVREIQPYFFISIQVPLILLQTNLVNIRLVLGMTQYCSMLLGTIVLALAADASGRLKTLFVCLFIAFVGGLSSAFAFNNLTIFIILRGIVGFATGMSIIKSSDKNTMNLVYGICTENVRNLHAHVNPIYKM